MYVNVNREPDPVQGSRQCCSCHDSYARWENQAMHSGLTPLITRTASTNHTCLLYADTHEHTRAMLKVQHAIMTLTHAIPVHIDQEHRTRCKPTVQVRAANIWWPCMHLGIRIKSHFSEDIINDKPLDLIILVILLHWAQGRHLFPIPKASSLAPNTKGYFRRML